MMSKWT